MLVAHNLIGLWIFSLRFKGPANCVLKQPKTGNQSSDDNENGSVRKPSIGT